MAGTAKQPRERKRQPTEVRRQLVVDAAREVIAERGLFATSMRDIAHAAEVSLGTLTYHFDGIAELLNQVLDREMTVFYETAVADARAQDSGLDGLLVLVDGFFADDRRTVQHWRLWLDFWGVSAHDERYAKWQEDTYLHWRDDVRSLFALAHERGELVSGDLDTTVFDFLALFDGLAVRAYLPRSPLSPADARAQLTRWVRSHEPVRRRKRSR